MKKIVIGMVAHVDAGKTTLSEALLYKGGALRKKGRVDHGDTFLDTDTQERARGITIFSKQARLAVGEYEWILLDTPGHVDFSAEMERALQVLDYAVLVINGAEGVQGHTRTLWRLLAQWEIPVFLFINKMDQSEYGREEILSEIAHTLSEGCVDFMDTGSEAFRESVALCDEKMLEAYLDTGAWDAAQIPELIAQRKVFPCFFGSALKDEGVDRLLQGMQQYMSEPEYTGEFGARVYKIGRDGQGNRLTYVKITGGNLGVRQSLSDSENRWNEKVNEIRLYSGEKYQSVSEAGAGEICVLTGLHETRAGEGLGAEKGDTQGVLTPVLTYQMHLPDGKDAAGVLPELKQLEEELPELHIVWDEALRELRIQIMGDVQLEIVQNILRERFDLEVSFDDGKILYRETIADTVEGVGHFEPLRHYAEVHLLLEPGEPGSGMIYDADCSEDVLAKNWQRLVLTHLAERTHRGVLVGAPITDIKITVVAGKAHNKHTEGGDFRQATYRAVRQGLMQARSSLLEPYYAFRLDIPGDMVGRAMTDMERMHGKINPPEIHGEQAVLTGCVPVSTVRGYPKDVVSYTQGLGSMFCEPAGYGPCHNPEEVVAQRAYEPENDFRNPAGSVFCAHGAGFQVPWDEVKDYMHVESVLRPRAETENVSPSASRQAQWESIGTEEIDAILERTFYANRTGTTVKRKWKHSRKVQAPAQGARPGKTVKKKDGKKYLLVDGYNIIFAWEDLAEIAKENLDGARGKLLDILCDYQGSTGVYLIVVFDAYRVKGHPTEVSDYHNIHVVFTKEAETADQFIEKFAVEHGEREHVTVATSDGLEQIIIRGQGCALLSARELREEIANVHERMAEKYLT